MPGQYVKYKHSITIEAICSILTLNFGIHFMRTLKIHVFICTSNFQMSAFHISDSFIVIFLFRGITVKQALIFPMSLLYLFIYLFVFNGKPAGIKRCFDLFQRKIYKRTYFFKR